MTTAVEYLAEKGLTLSLFEVLMGLWEAETEPVGPPDTDYHLPTAAKVGRRSGRSEQGAINGLIALRSRGLAIDNVIDDYEPARWTTTVEGERIAEASS
jgi:hypothetical protein